MQGHRCRAHVSFTHIAAPQCVSRTDGAQKVRRLHSLVSTARSIDSTFLRHAAMQVSNPRAAFLKVRQRGNITTSASSWGIQVRVHADYTDAAIGTPELEISFLAANSTLTNPVIVNTNTGFTGVLFNLPEVGFDDTRHGVTLSGQVDLPEDFGNPGACLITFKKTNSKIDRVYIEEAVATPNGVSEAGAVAFLTNSWIAAGTSNRVFFTAQPCLPQFTPAGLKKYRTEELESLRGGGDGDSGIRQGAERTYAYDVYNDLGGKNQFTVESAQRPILGKDRGGTLPYPRRLRTGRPTQKLATGPYAGQECESAPDKKSPIPWLPYDEQFFASKQDEFSVGTVYSVGEAASSVIKQLFDDKKGIDAFSGIFALDSLYSPGQPPDATPAPVPPIAPAATRETWAKPEDKVAIKATVKEALSPFKSASDDTIRKAYNDFPQHVREEIDAKLGAKPGPSNFWGFLQRFLPVSQDIVEFVRGLVQTWPPTLVRTNRKVTWQTDEEVGRQAKAGCNPFTIQIAGPDFLQATKVTEEDLGCLLCGQTIEQLVEDGKVFFQDYHTVLATDIAPKVQERYEAERAAERANKENTESTLAKLKSTVGFQYAGRGMFLKCDSTGAVPLVAIELWEPGQETPRVFTSTKDKPEVWQLAKAVYSTLDSAVHQLVAHFGETHAVMEPFAIAARRQLSALHPVFMLMQPHFRYTLCINANARSSLINAGGVVEKVFTAGPFSMTFSASMYGKTWRFDQQGLPFDLESRGLVAKKLKEDDVPRVTYDPEDWLLNDFPFAEDGLLVWNAIVDFFNEYLSLYYSNEGSHDKPKVTDDTELIAWYNEVREDGHPDVKEGWFELEDVASLVKILATMAWIGSAHHAAVNFGQYAYMGYMPNKASYVAHAIPAAGSDEETALIADYDFGFLQTLSDPIRAVQTMLLTKLLSAHAMDEVYLCTKTKWIQDPKGAKLQDNFIQALQAAEADMQARNEDPGSRARHHGPAGLAYNLMYPSTETNPVNTENRGITGRGIPYSVSI